MRLILFTGKGGVGKTTTSAATALRLADRGIKTLIVSTDAAHSLADALAMSLSSEPAEVAPGLFAAQLDTQGRFEESWQEIQRYLSGLLSAGGIDPIAAGELTVLPGIEEVLALLAVRELAASGRWDAVVLDCAPTAETLRLLALPEALGWYFNRVFPMHRALARGVRPLASVLGRGAAVPPESALDAVVRLTEELAKVHRLLTDPQTTSVRLVLTPEAIVAAETRRTFTALSLYGYRVDEVVVNRVIPDEGGAMSPWQRGWVAAQQAQLAELADSFADLPLRRSAHLAAEPVGTQALRAVATGLYGELPGPDPAAVAPFEPLLRLGSIGTPEEPRYELVLQLGLAARGEVTASRSGDELVVTVAGHRRVLSLPSVLRRCVVRSGRVSAGQLRLEFVPDPDLWPRG